MLLQRVLRCFDWVCALRQAVGSQNFNRPRIFLAREFCQSYVSLGKKLPSNLRECQKIYGIDKISTTVIFCYKAGSQPFDQNYYHYANVVRNQYFVKKIRRPYQFLQKKLKFTIFIKKEKYQLCMFLHQPIFMGVFTILANLFGKNILGEINFFLAILVRILGVRFILA